MKMHSPVKRPVLRYFGGKWVIAPWIIEHFPPHSIYCEPFGGAASVLLRKPYDPKVREFYNDLDERVHNIFRVLREQPDALYEALRLTTYSKSNYQAAVDDPDSGGDVERARKALIRSFMSVAPFNCTKTTPGFRMQNVNISHPNFRMPSDEWDTWREHIPHLVERLRRVFFFKKDALEVIRQCDSTNSLFYVDPPYIQASRAYGNALQYRHDYTDADHERLLDELMKVKGMVVLSGYDTPLYESLGWERRVRSVRKTNGHTAEEALWLNPLLIDRLERQEVFNLA